MSRIELDPKLGVNAHITFCPRCGGEGDSIVLVGARKNVLKCNNCGMNIFGHRQSDACPSCGNKRQAYGMSDQFTFVRKIGDWEKLPMICKKCEDEMTLFRSIVREGGIYWKCKDCHKEGVLKSSAPLAGLVREHAKIFPPDPVGIEFTKEECPACGPTKQEDEACQEQ